MFFIIQFLSRSKSQYYLNFYNNCLSTKLGSVAKALNFSDKHLILSFAPKNSRFILKSTLSLHNFYSCAHKARSLAFLVCV